MFKFLHHINAFIADISLLNEISNVLKTDSSDDIKADFEIDYEYFKRVLKSKDLLISFGMNPSALEVILSKVREIFFINF